jgi:predicted MFS family arabinose efflux permease
MMGEQFSPAADGGRSLDRKYPVMVACSFLAYAVVIGFARFSYGLFLPSIRRTLGGDFTIYGGIAAANFLGYLLGTLSIPLLNKRFRRPPTVASTLLTGLFLAISATSGNPLMLMIWRFVIGLFSGMATVLIMNDVLSRSPRIKQGQTAGITWMGASFGIVLTGFMAPVVIGPLQIHAWRASWAIMGTAGLVISGVLARLLVTTEESGKPRADGVTAPSTKRIISFLFDPCAFLWVTIAYLSYGFGYIIYVTYLVSALVSQGVPVTYIGLIWAGMGFAGMLSGLLWGRAVDARPDGTLLAGSLALGAIASLSLLTGDVALELAGAAVFGLAVFVGPPLIINVLLKREQDSQGYAATLSVLVAVFSTGQLLGPLAGGYLVDRHGTAAGGLMTFLALTLGALSAGAHSMVSGYRSHKKELGTRRQRNGKSFRDGTG